MEDLYRNPFSDYNANTMDSEQLTYYWENPFENYVVDITEEEFASERKPITFTGGRGTGKTMLLRHFQLDSEIVRAKCSGQNLKEAIIKAGYIGVYVRFDSPLLRGFYGKRIDDDKWEVIFSHFFEMTIAKSIIDTLIKLIDNGVIIDEEGNKLFEAIKEITFQEAKDINDLSRIFRNQINYINEYRSKIVFGEIPFSPVRLFSFGEIIKSIVEQIRKMCKGLNKANFLVLIDEYENFLEYQQRIVNSVIKFSDNIALRIGMRPMGFHTFDTVSGNEFIKEGRDYRNVVLENPLIRKDEGDGAKYIDFLLGIAEKRLKNVPLFAQNNLTDLRTFLGDREDLVEEAKKITKGRDTHFGAYLKEIEKIYKKKKWDFGAVTEEKLSELRYPDNPLYEMQNLRMLLKPFPIDFVINAFHDYLNKIESNGSKKYKLDYQSKYKLAYVFVLRNIYRAETKLYYGVNDFAYLSSGIAGVFVELCRSAFQYAYFSSKEALFSGSISPDIQTKAARDVGKSELDQLKRISKVGNGVFNLAMNLGRRFSDYHIDKRIKYPETNQICFNSSALKEGTIEYDTFQAAVMWSAIQQKKDLQQASIGKDDDEIYILNRIFAPVFNISARTRGGKNEELDLDKFSKYLNQNVMEEAIEDSVDDEEQDGEEYTQMTLFDDIISTTKK